MQQGSDEGSELEGDVRGEGDVCVGALGRREGRERGNSYT